MPISNVSLDLSFPDPERIRGDASDAITVGETPILIVAENTIRRGLTIWNTHTALMYFDIQELPSNLKFMFKLQPDAFYEMPYPAFENTIYGVSSSGSGKILVRELNKL